MNKKFFSAIVLAGLLQLSLPAFTQTGPPPPPSSGHGSTFNSTPANSGGGGGAPIGSGLALLLVLGSSYAAWKYLYGAQEPAE